VRTKEERDVERAHAKEGRLNEKRARAVLRSEWETGEDNHFPPECRQRTSTSDRKYHGSTGGRPSSTKCRWKRVGEKTQEKKKKKKTVQLFRS